ncbi:MAG: CRISPR-associated protein Cas4 [Candidatus Lokiarchaeota archaeon]|nr:CRISPR-associated protein Cas4 [Candidatus Lokiarchaeota archaeon]
MFTHDYIEPHQVNSFVYCRRKWYYQNRLKLRLERDNLILGQKIHQEHKLTRYKYKELYMTSEQLKLKGMCDYVIEDEGVLVPLELKIGKSNNGRPFENDIAQLVCYILLLEDYLKSPLTHGYLLYLGSRQKLKIKCDKKARSELFTIIKSIREQVRLNKIPKLPQTNDRCKNCSFFDYCWY